MDAAHQDMIGFTALHTVVVRDCLDCVPMLLERMSDAAIRKTSKYGFTAMQIALSRGSFALARMIHKRLYGNAFITEHYLDHEARRLRAKYPRMSSTVGYYNYEPKPQ